MVSKANNTSMASSKINQDDEFYTQIEDIENELIHYKESFKNKVVFCNCDDPSESNFWKYFSQHFRHFGLKKLISTHYKKEGQSYKQEITTMGELPIKTPLIGNGDFRSEECIDILKEVDIVVTNPPFSLFREYIAQMVEYNKHFLIMGNMNAISYKNTFKLIKENKAWIGATPFRQMKFKKPDGTYQALGLVCWFTNIEHKKRHDKMVLYKKYIGNESEYPKYDNFDAININKTKDIPGDYVGVMGVPISFMDKYNPEQFKIIGNEYDLNIEGGRGYVNKKRMYSRIFICNRKVNES